MTETELPAIVVNASGVLEGTVDHEEVIACNVDSHKCQGEEEQSVCSVKDGASLSRNLNENVYETPDGDPREKAMTYLEESGAIRMFQELATEIVQNRPDNPIHYIIDTLQRKKSENGTT